MQDESTPPPPAKQPWPFPFNILKEEWGEVSRAKWSFFLCAVVFMAVGGCAIYFLFSVFVIPGKEATIQALEAKSGNGTPHVTYPSVVWNGPTNTLYTTNQYCFYQAHGDCAITNISNPSSSETAWTSMTISNSSSRVIFLYMTDPSVRSVGAATTKGLRIMPGKLGIVSAMCFGRSLCQYVNISEQ